MATKKNASISQGRDVKNEIHIHYSAGLKEVLWLFFPSFFFFFFFTSFLLHCRRRWSANSLPFYHHIIVLPEQTDRGFV